MEGFIAYNTGLFEAATVARIIDHYRMLLSGIVANPSQPIAMLPLMTVQERKQVIEEWNRTEAQYPLDKCVHELFEEQVARTPQAVALVHEREQLAYEKLNRRANQVAWRLRELGVGPEIRVAICAERSFELIIGMLGILKAGGVYVPLDVSYPEERLKFMLADSAPVVLLTQGHLTRLVSGTSPTLPVLDLSDASAWAGLPDTNPQRATTGVSSENPAYIIYTSGSTGQPNGVMIEHRSVSGHITVLRTQWQICAEDRILQFASLQLRRVGGGDLCCFALWGNTGAAQRWLAVRRAGILETGRTTGNHDDGSPHAVLEAACGGYKRQHSIVCQTLDDRRGSSGAASIRKLVFGK